MEIYPAKHFITEEDRLRKAINDIEEELDERLKILKHEEKLLEAQRLEQRTRFDLEMLREIGLLLRDRELFTPHGPAAGRLGPLDADGLHAFRLYHGDR